METTQSDLGVPHVVFATPEGRLARVDHGNIVGRSPRAALRLTDPGVSEAHALVSLRGSSLRLLALRGRLQVGGETTSDVELEEGLAVAFAPGVVLRVDEVVLPPSVLGLLGDGLPRQILEPISTLEPALPRLVPRAISDAHPLIWSDGDRFHLRLPGREDVDAAPGLTFEAQGRRFTFVSVPLAEGAVPVTEDGGSFDVPLTLVARYDSVHLRLRERTAVVTGNPARLLSDLAVMGVPAEWDTLAHELWPDETDAVLLRQRWDRTVARLRQRLREHGVRPSLLRSDGRGRIEVVLGPRDQVIDET